MADEARRTGRGERGGTGSRTSQEDREARAQDRSREAQRHTADMARRYATEIERSSREVRLFAGTPEVPEGAERLVPTVRVVAQDTVTAVLELGRGRADLCDLAVLDFASFTRPGGSYEHGAMAQEQALCAESFLYNVLQGQGGWYAENRRRLLNCNLYRNRALVVPKVRFEREGYHSYADVIVAAAPNARRARSEYHVGEEDLLDALRSRVAFVLAVADALGRPKLVLGAFGCGVFGWDPDVVAEAFRAELAGGTHTVREVVFAVPQSRFTDNHLRFEHAFSTFPERNEAPLAPEVPAPAADVAGPTDPDAAGDDADDEDDWHKYL